MWKRKKESGTGPGEVKSSRSPGRRRQYSGTPSSSLKEGGQRTLRATKGPKKGLDNGKKSTKKTPQSNKEKFGTRRKGKALSLPWKKAGAKTMTN